MNDIENIIANPSTAPIPASTTQLLALATGLAARATITNFAAITVYLERVFDAGFPEMAVVCIRDAVRRDSDLLNTVAFLGIVRGLIGVYVARNELSGILTNFAPLPSR